MNRLLIAALALAAFVPALAPAAQIVDPVIPKPFSEAPMDPPTLIQGGPAAPPPRPFKNELAAQRDADARACLTLPTNRQVHACAERYRSHAARARARTVKVAAKPSAPSAEVKPETAPPIDFTKAPPASKGVDSSTKGAVAAKAPEPAKAPPEPPKTSDVIKLPALKPAAPAPEPPKPAATPAPSKAPEPAKK